MVSYFGHGCFGLTGTHTTLCVINTKGASCPRQNNPVVSLSPWLLPAILLWQKISQYQHLVKPWNCSVLQPELNRTLAQSKKSDIDSGLSALIYS